MSQSKRLHFKDLDVMRFFAFAPVFLYSVFYLTRTETEGVHFEMTRLFSLIKTNSLDLFFFLSAFLICSQGLREYKYTHTFSVRNFLIRRFLRIAPLFLILLTFAFLIHPWILKILKLNHIPAPDFVDYFVHPPFRFLNISKEQFIYASVSWSIYMFLQFYLVIGIILKYFAKNLVIVSLVFTLIGIGTRLVHGFVSIPFDFDMLAFLTPAGAGILLAHLIRQESPYINSVKQLSKSVVTTIYLSGTAVVATGYVFFANSILLTAILPVVTTLFFSFIVVEQTFGKNSPFKLRNNKVLSHLGKISFGTLVYQSILNAIILIGFDSLDFEINSQSTKIAFLAISAILTWVVSDLSFNILEKPLLRLRREFKKT